MSRLHVVLKSAIDLDDAWALVGVFTSRHRADAAIIGAGRFMVATVAPDHPYREGQLRDVRVVSVLSGAQITPAKWPK